MSRRCPAAQLALSFLSIRPLVEEQAVAAGQADMFAGELEQPGDEASDQGRALGAGDADDGEAALVAGREQVVHDGLADGTRLAPAPA